jgi:hypothetical protein
MLTCGVYLGQRRRNCFIECLRVVVPILLVASVQPVLGEALHRRKAELRPLRVSYDTLQAIITRTSVLATNGSVSPKGISEKLNLRSGDIEVDLSGSLLRPASVRIPDKLDGFDYSFRAVDANISFISIRFRQYSRELEVEGLSAENTDAVFSAIKEYIEKASTPFGGAVVSQVRFMVLAIVLPTLAVFLFVDWWYSRCRRKLGKLVAVLGLFLLLLILPTDEMFAGFLALQQDPDWVVRFGPQIGLAGLLVSIVALIPLPWFNSAEASSVDPDQSVLKSSPRLVRKRKNQK